MEARWAARHLLAEEEVVVAVANVDLKAVVINSFREDHKTVAANKGKQGLLKAAMTSKGRQDLHKAAMANKGRQDHKALKVNKDKEDSKTAVISNRRLDSRVKADSKFNGNNKITAKAVSKPKDRNGLTERKGREDHRARMDSKFKDNEATENKVHVAVNPGCKALLIVQRWRVCAMTLNLEN